MNGWLTALLIVMAVILALFSLVSIWVRLTVRIDGGTEVWLKFLFFRFRLVPGKKKKKPKPRDFKIGRFRRLQAKKREKALRRAEKARLKEEKKAKKAGKPPPEEQKEKSSPLSVVTDNLELIKKLISLLGSWLKTSLRIDLSLLDIRVASDDAAKTALSYAAASGAVAEFLTFLTENTHFCYTSRAVVRICPDFTASESQLRLKFTVRLRIRHVLMLAVKAAILYLKR